MENCVAMATTHVDDIAMSVTPTWIQKMSEGFVKRFGKVTEQHLPFTHCGCDYIKVEDGYMVSQSDFAGKLKPAEVPDRDGSSKLNKDELSSL